MDKTIKKFQKCRNMIDSEDVIFKNEKRTVIPKNIIDYNDYKYNNLPGRLKLLNARCCRRAKMCHAKINAHPKDCYLKCVEEKIEVKQPLRECIIKNWPDSREDEKTE